LDYQYTLNKKNKVRREKNKSFSGVSTSERGWAQGKGEGR
jgi:hypothetical protein